MYRVARPPKHRVRSELGWRRIMSADLDPFAAPSLGDSGDAVDAQAIARNIAALKARQKAGKGSLKAGKKVVAEVDTGSE